MAVFVNDLAEAIWLPFRVVFAKEDSEVVGFAVFYCGMSVVFIDVLVGESDEAVFGKILNVDLSADLETFSEDNGRVKFVGLIIYKYWVWNFSVEDFSEFLDSIRQDSIP